MKGFLDAQQVSWSEGIHSPDRFGRVLERERERSDRSGQGFALVLFEPDDPGDSGREIGAFLEGLVAQRARAIDEIGWFEDGTLGVALPATSPEGAWKFVADVTARIPGDMPDPTCRVFFYPSSWFTGNDGAGEGAGEGKREERKADSAGNGAGPTEPLRNGRIDGGMGSLVCRPVPAWKRGLDILGSLAGLLLLSPLFLLIAVFIRIVSPGPVFYRQERIGYLGRPFTLWKFRTMHVNNDAEIHRRHIDSAIAGDAPITKLDDLNDARIIPFGKFMRRSGIDELPQLFNVLRGDMSLVGPRPCVRYEAEKFLQWQTKRYDALPGISGLWQVSGKNRLTFKEMTRLDIRYSRNVSPRMDARILLRTAPAVMNEVLKFHPRRKVIEQEAPESPEMQQRFAPVRQNTGRPDA